MSTSGLTRRKFSAKMLLFGFPYSADYSGLTLKNILIVVAAGAAEVENLKAGLKKAKRDAAEQMAVAERAVVEVKTGKTVSEKHKVRVVEVQHELKDAVMKCEDLEQKRIRPLS